jgi:hypothetical protein
MTNNSSNNSSNKPYTYTPVCSWIGTGEGCGQTSQAESSYCVEHYALVYRVGSGKVRKRDTLQAQRVRLTQQLLQEAIDQLEAEGFDVYGDSEREKELELELVEE